MNSALHRGLDSSFDGIRRTEKLLKSSFSKKLMPVGLPSEEKILDPQGPFLQSWNKIFVLSCVISVSLDPLFFYVPVIDNRKMCLRLDGKVEAVVCILRFFTDLFYVVHIVFQFRKRFIGPSSRIFGRGVLVEDSLTIATRYLSSYFLIDISSVLPLPQVFGAIWYLCSIERAAQCWQDACSKHPDCTFTSLYCDHNYSNEGNLFLTVMCPSAKKANIGPFNFGIFIQALQPDIVESDFPKKFLHCFWWGLRNLSCLGQNLITSPCTWENCFAIFVCVSGLVLFASLLGNVQMCWRSTNTRVEEMRLRRKDVEQWMSCRLLPENLRERVRRYEHYTWQETRGVNEHSLLHNLPRYIERDFKRHLCSDLLMFQCLKRWMNNCWRRSVLVSSQCCT
ncbi:unnamed protein product [Citrullus colocynthis]|uniref:Ion transport domain-containing protein n=1 Tax=Citrullus colocynthis TaxID=252529 RepID=A0ABP0YCI3_9ROSI